jgi:epimerase EvaD
MKARELAVRGAFEFTPDRHLDDRGFFATPFEEQSFVDAVGHPLFDVSQVSVSRSRRGVLRGVHYTATPPGRPKYASCVRGRAYDVVIDLRVGSPTFGRHDVVVLDAAELRAVYFPVGVGHAFLALEDDTTMNYLIAGGYVPSDEHALAPFDPELGVAWPEGLVPVLSGRDREAPTLAEALAANLLPAYADALELERSFARGR